MTREGGPPFNLNFIEFGDPTTHPVSAIPLKPSTFIRIFGGVGEDGSRGGARGARNPSSSTPIWERKTRIDLKSIHRNIRSARAEFVESNGMKKPLGREFKETII
jgi:hypothetical protein